MVLSQISSCKKGMWRRPVPKSHKTVRHYNSTSGKSRKEARCHRKGACSVKGSEKPQQKLGPEKLRAKGQAGPELFRQLGRRLQCPSVTGQLRHPHRAQPGFPSPSKAAPLPFPIASPQTLDLPPPTWHFLPSRKSSGPAQDKNTQKTTLKREYTSVQKP